MGSNVSHNNQPFYGSNVSLSNISTSHVGENKEYGTENKRF
jgi:hypothetical protein